MMGQCVIARAAKQSCWLTLTDDDVPLGCCGALRLAMTRGLLMLILDCLEKNGGRDRD